ncbi:MAG: DUF302 domain-containing protein [Acidimicrobiia bacterium]|nr:DUF302 domain-containing protein [Acidimicrobiia bacterium]
MVYEEVVVLDAPFDDALARVKEAFAAEGFGTLTEIDLQATLHAKVGKEMGRYVIVGACNPRLASRAVDALPSIGVLLPCNVVVREVDEGVSVEAMDPGLMATIAASAELGPIAAEARELIAAALARLTI